MAASPLRSLAGRFMADYGIVLALFLLCVYFAWATTTKQQATGASGGRQLAEAIALTTVPGAAVLIVAREGPEGTEFAEALAAALAASGRRVIATARAPAGARQALERL